MSGLWHRSLSDSETRRITAGKTGGERERRRAIESEEKTFLAARAAESKKAKDVVILDLRQQSNFTDYFIICSGNTQRQTKAIGDAIIEKLEMEGVSPWHSDGLDGNIWMLLDYGDMVVHIFESQFREFYDLEHLWGDAPRLKLPRRKKQAKHDTE